MQVYNNFFHNYVSGTYLLNQLLHEKTHCTVNDRIIFSFLFKISISSPGSQQALQKLPPGTIDSGKNEFFTSKTPFKMGFLFMHNRLFLFGYECFNGNGNVFA